MKTLAELQAIRDKSKQQTELRKDHNGYKVVVGMATCGIAAGARPVMSTLLDEVVNQNIENVVVTQTGCIGICRLEPIVEIFNPEGEKVTYVNIDPKKALEIVEKHLKQGKVITEYTIGYNEANQK